MSLYFLVLEIKLNVSNSCREIENTHAASPAGFPNTLLTIIIRSCDELKMTHNMTYIRLKDNNGHSTCITGVRERGTATRSTYSHLP